MDWGSVHIVSPKSRRIYVNGNYDESAGTSPVTIAVEYGRNTFETLTGAGTVDNRGIVTVSASNSHPHLFLSPV